MFCFKLFLILFRAIVRSVTKAKIKVMLQNVESSDSDMKSFIWVWLWCSRPGKCSLPQVFHHKKSIFSKLVILKYQLNLFLLLYTETTSRLIGEKSQRTSIMLTLQLWKTDFLCVSVVSCISWVSADFPAGIPVWWRISQRKSSLRDTLVSFTEWKQWKSNIFLEGIYIINTRAFVASYRNTHLSFHGRRNK